jgi:hypothetical protein
MKLSEAILLGSTVLSPRAGGQHFSETQQGCALGMAAVARGCTFHTVRTPFPERDRRTLGVEGVWGTWVLQEVERPCDCWRIWIRRRMRIKEVIAHLFDYHVMSRKNWTLERLVAWVERVEPEEVTVSISWPRIPRLASLRSEPAKLQEEAENWQVRRRAFEARHQSARSRG